ncbi:MAG: CHASE2 domain-containing protein [Leptolyngbyaceae cyanobacterium SM2_3_12]|nr:CHASE2 domain-containing protein [Leptolyngbyaceae cyanobacterium SM2_3_12]
MAAHVAADSAPVQLLDRRLQTLFFEIRGPVAAPDDIVILAVDDESFSQAEHYRADPDQFKALAPIATIPWQRQAYAIAIERLLQAGARAVAVDVLFLAPSSYGSADDDALAKVLEKYGDRVILAATYDDANLRQGALIRPTKPIPQFLDTPVQTGTINFPIELDGRIHRQGRAYLKDLRRIMADIDATTTLGSELDQTLSFTEATLRSPR